MFTIVVVKSKIIEDNKKNVQGMDIHIAQTGNDNDIKNDFEHSPTLPKKTRKRLWRGTRHQ